MVVREELNIDVPYQSISPSCCVKLSSVERISRWIPVVGAAVASVGYCFRSRQIVQLRKQEASRERDANIKSLETARLDNIITIRMNLIGLACAGALFGLAILAHPSPDQ
jgi:hypothetical protein